MIYLKQLIVAGLLGVTAGAIVAIGTYSASAPAQPVQYQPVVLVGDPRLQ